MTLVDLPQTYLIIIQSLTILGEFGSIKDLSYLGSDASIPRTIRAISSPMRSLYASGAAT